MEGLCFTSIAKYLLSLDRNTYFGFDMDAMVFTTSCKWNLSWWIGGVHGPILLEYSPNLPINLDL
ncbi:hypothetical protein JCM15415_03730 [Methanobacterium movens]